MKKRILLFATGIMFIASSVFAQTVTTTEYYVVKRPVMPTVTRVVSPGPDYVWIDEDWKYNTTTNSYEWTGGHWMQPPAAGQHYYKGKWKKDKKGYSWSSGYWK